LTAAIALGAAACRTAARVRQDAGLLRSALHPTLATEKRQETVDRHISDTVVPDHSGVVLEADRLAPDGADDLRVVLERHRRLRRVDDHRDLRLEVVLPLDASGDLGASDDVELKRDGVDVQVLDGGTVPQQDRAGAGHSWAVLRGIHIDLERRRAGRADAGDEL
jgi:hypothetical protein